MDKELYMCGKPEAVNKVIEYLKNSDFWNKDGIWLVDLLPELTEEYMEEHDIKRKTN